VVGEAVIVDQSEQTDGRSCFCGQRFDEGHRRVRSVPPTCRGG
jgi:hypothetical protein